MNKINRLGLWGACLGGTGVALGAFGAHALRAVLPEALLSTFETAVRYQLMHALAILVCGVILNQGTYKRWAKVSGYFFLIGVLLFSGSLYLLVWAKHTGHTSLGALGLLTPLGGLFLLAGWLLLAFSFLPRNQGA